MSSSRTRSTWPLPDRAGSALILVLVMTAGLAALAMSAIFLASSSSLMTKYYDRERNYRYAAEQALQVGVSRLAKNFDVSSELGVVEMWCAIETEAVSRLRHRDRHHHYFLPRQHIDDCANIGPVVHLHKVRHDLELVARRRTLDQRVETPLSAQCVGERAAAPREGADAPVGAVVGVRGEPRLVRAVKGAQSKMCDPSGRIRLLRAKCYSCQSARSSVAHSLNTRLGAPSITSTMISLARSKEMRCSATIRARYEASTRRATLCRAGIEQKARVSSTKPP